MNRTSRSIRLLSAGAALTIAITLLHGVASMAQPTARAARPGEEGERDRRLGSRDDAPASVGFGLHCGDLCAGYGIDIPHSRVCDCPLLGRLLPRGLARQTHTA